MTYVIEPAGPEALTEAERIDDDASLLFADAGIVFDLTADHPFVLAEHARWRHCAEQGALLVARHDTTNERVAFAAIDRVDDASYLDQLAVLRSAMRRGIGRRLLAATASWARLRGDSALWLTTYAHVPWNRPFYEAHGFSVVPESDCGADIREILAEQREYLPFPNERVAMRRAI